MGFKKSASDQPNRFFARMWRKTWFSGLVSFIIFIGILRGMSGLFSIGSGTEKKFDYSEETVRAVETSRSTDFDPQQPLILAHLPPQRVAKLADAYPNLEPIPSIDYSEGENAAWFPKGESPMLKDLVEAGELPPVADRVGPEPMVVEGVDGIGTYGGSWTMPSAFNNQRSVLNSRYGGVGFVRWSPQGPPLVPFVAKDWEVSEDNRVYTFYLRKGMKWSDGHPFTSEDILFAWEVSTGLAVYQKKLELGDTSANKPNLILDLPLSTKLEALDDYTVRFTFEKPFGLFLGKLATSGGCEFFSHPKHYLEKFYYDEMYDHVAPGKRDAELIDQMVREQNLPDAKALWWQAKFPTNPERPSLSAWICRSKRLTSPFEFVRNPYYFVVDSEGNQLPYLDRMFVEVKNPRMINNAVSQGNYKFHVFVDLGVEYDEMAATQERNGYKIHHWYSGDSSKFVISFNQNIRGVGGETRESRNKKEFFSTLKVRKALSVAINRQAIIDALYGGMGEGTQNMPRKESVFYDEESLYSYTRFDPEQANKWLDEAGYTNRDSEGYRTFKDGTKLSIIMAISRPSNEGMVNFIINDWAEVGVRGIFVIRSSALLGLMSKQHSNDVFIWNGNNEFYPVLNPQYFLTGYWSPAWRKYYDLISRGYTPEQIEATESKLIEEIPENHPVARSIRIYEQVKGESNLIRQAELFREIVRIAAENVWAISVVEAPPTLAIVKNDFRGVPDTVVSAWDFLTPKNAFPETFFVETPRRIPAVEENLKAQILEPQYQNEDAKIDAGFEGGERNLLGGFFKYGFLMIACLTVIGISVRKPYIARRLLLMIPTLFIISIITFTIIKLPEGDYITNRIAEMKDKGQEVDQAEIEQIIDMFNLDDPTYKQYLEWMGFKWFVTFDEADKGLMQGFMGYSMQSLRPVNSMVGDRLLLTMGISLGTVLFMWIVSIPLGVYCALRQYSFMDYALTFIGFLGMCIPNFVLALFFIYIADVKFGVKVSGLFSPQFAADPTWSMAKFVDLLQHIWVPIVVSAAAGTGAGIRSFRANMLDELRKPYVTTARAKGLSPGKIIFQYPFRMCLNPFISGIGGIFPMLLSGSALIAIVLSLPTIGPLQLESVMMQDMYMAGSLMMMFTILGVIGTLVSDLLLLVLDPRIRYSGGSR